jgi:hypothetical protein
MPHLVDHIDLFRIRDMHVFVRVYLILFILLVIVLGLAGQEVVPQDRPDRAALQKQVVEFAENAAKVVLGALLGSLSMAKAGKQKGEQKPTPGGGTTPESS